ncbi:MAG: hypothetical protein P8L49_13220 [Opitutaceae bacterium]|jgi:hypothetical protein|nr:hypothetical protein [Opitutaceae bacterium]
MIPTENEHYPNAAKAILALFAIFMVVGPLMLQSADKKTRGHFTARDGRSMQESVGTQEQKPAPVDQVFEIAQKAQLNGEAVHSVKAKRWYNPSGWRSPFGSKNSKSAQKIRENEAILRAELEKRIEAEELRAQKELYRRISEEENQARQELRKRLEEEERNALVARKVKLEGKQAVPRKVSPWYSRSGWRSAFPKQEGKFKGYLAYNEPLPLRFSNEYILSDQSLSPALPELTMINASQEPLIVETRLSEQEIHRNELLRQVIVKMDPYTIVSGGIDTRIPRPNIAGPRFEMEESSDTVVRPDEVLIFFENQRGEGSRRTIVPFSPALPAQQSPIDSKAGYRIEK